MLSTTKNERVILLLFPSSYTEREEEGEGGRVVIVTLDHERKETNSSPNKKKGRWRRSYSRPSRGLTHPLSKEKVKRKILSTIKG